MYFFTPAAKIDKKIVKRSADDDGESYTPKTNVYVVTPSKNLEEYLAEVKLSNEKEFLSSTAKTVTEVKEEIKLATTEAALIPTLSSNPFLPPSIGEVTASVSVPVSDKVEDETTTQSIKALFDAVVATDTTQASTSSAFEPTTSSAALSSVESSVVESTSAISTHDSTTPESTTHDSTTSSTTTEKSEEKDSDEDDSEEENTVRLRRRRVKGGGVVPKLHKLIHNFHTNRIFLVKKYLTAKKRLQRSSPVQQKQQPVKPPAPQHRPIYLPQLKREVKLVESWNSLKILQL